jgi:hypothetical protein
MMTKKTVVYIYIYIHIHTHTYIYTHTQYLSVLGCALRLEGFSPEIRHFTNNCKQIKSVYGYSVREGMHE